MEPIADSTQDLQVNQRSDEEDFLNAWNLALGSMVPLSLKSAFELGVFEILAKSGPGANLSAAQIVDQMSDCNNPDAPIMLDRILRLLASHHVLSCVVIGDERFYGLTSMAKYYVANEDGVSLGPLIQLILDNVFLATWPYLKDAILDGELPFKRTYGIHTFEYPKLDPRFNKILNAGMINASTIIVKKILEKYNGFERLKQLVDVGGSLGVTLEAITTKYPHIKGINFDLPHVIEHARPHPGVEHIGGDMFESVPKGDVIFMKWILHDWSDKHCSKILKNCYDATPDHGMVIVVEEILPIMAETSVPVQITSRSNVGMMTVNSGGKERTRTEFLALAIEAGFSGIRFECFVCNNWVMEFFK